MTALLVVELAHDELHKRPPTASKEAPRRVIANFSKCRRQAHQTYLRLNKQVDIINFCKPHLKSNSYARLNTQGPEALPKIRSGFKGPKEVTDQPLARNFWHYSVYPSPQENLCKKQPAGRFAISLSLEESFRGCTKIVFTMTLPAALATGAIRRTGGFYQTGHFLEGTVLNDNGQDAVAEFSGIKSNFYDGTLLVTGAQGRVEHCQAGEEGCLVEEAHKNITGGSRRLFQRAFSMSEKLNRGGDNYTRDEVLATSIRKRKTA